MAWGADLALRPNESGARVSSCACRMHGAARAALSIRDGAVLVHSTVSCSYGLMALRQSVRPSDFRLSTTAMDESDVVCGAEGLLDRAMAAAAQRAFAVLTVVTGCLGELVVADLQGCLRKHGTAQSTILIRSAATDGTSHDGTLEVLRAIVERMMPAEVCPRRVNLVGLLGDDFNVDCDLRAFESLLGPELELGAVLPYDTWNHLVRAPSAAVNIVLPGYEPIAADMQKRFGTPWRAVPFPYGFAASREFRRIVRAALPGARVPSCGREQARVLHLLQPLRGYLAQLDGLPIAVAGDCTRAASLARFLEHELGLRVLVANSASSDQEDLARTVHASRAVALFGSTFERVLAGRLRIPLIRWVFPVFDAVSLIRPSFVGFDGVLALVEALLDALLASREAAEPYFSLGESHDCEHLRVVST